MIRQTVGLQEFRMAFPASVPMVRRIFGAKTDAPAPPEGCGRMAVE